MNGLLKLSFCVDYSINYSTTSEFVCQATCNSTTSLHIYTAEFKCVQICMLKWCAVFLLAAFQHALRVLGSLLVYMHLFRWRGKWAWNLFPWPLHKQMLARISGDCYSPENYEMIQNYYGLHYLGVHYQHGHRRPMVCFGLAYISID